MTEVLQAPPEPNEEIHFARGPHASLRADGGCKSIGAAELLEHRRSVLVWGQQSWEWMGEAHPASMKTRELRCERVTPAHSSVQNDQSTSFVVVLLDPQRYLVITGSQHSDVQDTTIVTLCADGQGLKAIIGEGPPTLHCRNLCAAVGFGDGRLLVAGGAVWSATAAGRKLCLASTEILDRRTWTFTQGPSMSIARGSCAAARLGPTRVIVMGGYDGVRRLASTEVLDESSMTFCPGPSMMEPRSGFAVVHVGPSHLLIVGGVGHLKRLSSTELLNIDTMTFTPGPQLLSPRAGCAAVLVNENRGHAAEE